VGPSAHHPDGGTPKSFLHVHERDSATRTCGDGVPWLAHAHVVLLNPRSTTSIRPPIHPSLPLSHTDSLDVHSLSGFFLAFHLLLGFPRPRNWDWPDRIRSLIYFSRSEEIA